MPTKLLHARATLHPRAGAELRLAVVADTHSQPHPDAERHLRQFAPDAILHAGDIGDPAVLRQLAAIAPLHAVRGNIDGRGLPDVLILDLFPDPAPAPTSSAVPADGEDAEDAADAEDAEDEGGETAVSDPPGVRVLMTHIAVAGPRLRAEVARAAAAQRASLVVCGHSHVPFIGRDRGLAVFNPGSVGPRRFDLPIVFGTIVVASGRVRLAHIDCETGQPWSPP